MQNIADDIEMHVSTVSRAVKGKYIQYPGGTIGMRDIFNSSQTFGEQDSTTEEIKEEIKRLVKEEDKKPIILMISDAAVEIKINTTLGSMDETIPIDKDGEDLNIGFNPKFLIDALRAIDDEEIDIYLLSQRAPAFIRDGKNYCYLVLPVNFINID